MFGWKSLELLFAMCLESTMLEKIMGRCWLTTSCLTIIWSYHGPPKITFIDLLCPPQSRDSILDVWQLAHLKAICSILWSHDLDLRLFCRFLALNFHQTSHWGNWFVWWSCLCNDCCKKKCHKIRSSQFTPIMTYSFYSRLNYGRKSITYLSLKLFTILVKMLPKFLIHFYLVT